MQATTETPSRTPALFRTLPPHAQAAALSGPEAPAWIESLARYGFVEAQVLLGQLCLEGRAPRCVPGAAYAWFAAAADAGHPPAINMQGRCLEHGWDVDRDPVRAASCYRRAAEAGLDWGQFNLGCALLRGIGMTPDRPAAFEWFAQAAAQGLAKAMNMLGRFHEEGWDRPASRVAAAHWYRRAAEGGDFRGQFNLASLLHRQGRSADAAAWLRAAIAAGSPDFLAEAATLLESNDDPALRWLGHDARRRLASCE